MISQSDRMASRLAFAIILVASLSACTGQPAVKSRPASAGTVTQPPTSVAQQAVSIALRQVGVPYRYGGNTPSGFDCSGLVHYSYQRAGKIVPRTTTQLWNTTSAVDNDDIRVGDLLFFRFDGKMSHVGMYVGNSRFVHAPSSGKTVSVESLSSDYYRQAFVRAGRPK